jgi:hypothetical protein
MYVGTLLNGGDVVLFNTTKRKAGATIYTFLPTA